MTALLHEMLSELAAPLLLVGSDKRICFASPAFRRLTGIGADKPPCDVLLHSAKSTVAPGHCCWDVIDVYLAAGESGLWQLRDDQGTWQPVLCEMRAIEMAGKPVMIAIEVRLQQGLVSPIALSFFRCLRRSAADTREYEKNVAEYLRKHYGYGQVFWPYSEAGSDAQGLREAIDAVTPQVGQTELFDLIVEQAGRKRILHVFQSAREGRTVCLVVSDAGRRFSDEIICALRAAVTVWAEPVQAPDTARRSTSTALIELLSPAEREILACLQAGMPDKEIARLRQASVNTVRNQVSAVMRKLGVHKRAQLVALSLSRIQAD